MLLAESVGKVVRRGDILGSGANNDYLVLDVVDTDANEAVLKCYDIQAAMSKGDALVPRDGLVTILSEATVGGVDLGSVTLKREGDVVSAWIFEDKVLVPLPPANS